MYQPMPQGIHVIIREVVLGDIGVESPSPLSIVENMNEKKQEK